MNLQFGSLMMLWFSPLKTYENAWFTADQGGSWWATSYAGGGCEMPCAQGNSTLQFFTFGVPVPDDPGSIEPGKHVVFFTSRVAVQWIIMKLWLTRFYHARLSVLTVLLWPLEERPRRGNLWWGVAEAATAAGLHSVCPVKSKFLVPRLFPLVAQGRWRNAGKLCKREALSRLAVLCSKGAVSNIFNKNISMLIRKCCPVV